MLRLGLFALVACLVYSGQAQENDCHLKRNSAGIKVYTCKTEQEKFKLLRTEVELINTTPQQVKDFVWRVSNYKTWQYNLLEAEPIASKENTELAYRALIDAPWPVENREVIVNMKSWESDSVIQITIQHIPYEPAPPDGYVRVPYFKAHWVIEPNGNDLKITYTLRIDPGGSVPAWLVNIAMADGPYVSFKNLKAQLNPK